MKQLKEMEDVNLFAFGLNESLIAGIFLTLNLRSIPNFTLFIDIFVDHI